jgi:hypothetical protein
MPKSPDDLLQPVGNPADAVDISLDLDAAAGDVLGGDILGAADLLDFAGPACGF